VPLRTCVGCRRVRPQAELVRVVATPTGVQVGRGLPGRGAWLCAGSSACVEEAVRRRSLARALRTQVGEEAVERLRQVSGPGPE